MKKTFICLYCLFIICICTYAQQLDAYKYIIVENCEYVNGGSDIWGISSMVRQVFSDKNFTIISNQNVLKTLSAQERRAVLICNIQHTDVVYGQETVTLTFFDISGNVVLVSSGSGVGLTRQSDFNKATRSALSKIVHMDYHYNPNLNIKTDNVEHTFYTESSIKDYLNNTAHLSSLEGIYKVLPNEHSAFYRIGIVKDGDIYKGIVINSDTEGWDIGDVKATFERASMGLFSTCWYLFDKTPYETVAQIDVRGILKVDFPGKDMNGIQLLKIYPISNIDNDSETIQPSNIPQVGQEKASGTGFVISKNGYIATNYHVIEDNRGIITDFNIDGKDMHYSAEVVACDRKNDVAIIKIVDTKFTSFKELPYTIETRAAVGTEVFTIGYPLNTVMGKNFKVTNGIISAKTGINDDYRYFQISVPLQPGNSGGPLFNSNGNVIGITTATLNGEAVSADVQNVNYAIKSLYLLNLINSEPSIEELPEKSTIAEFLLEHKIDVLKDFICLIKIY